MTGVERAGQAVAEAWGRVYRLAAGQGGVEPKGLDAALNNLVRAVRELAAAEIERSEFQRGPVAGSEHYVSGYSDGLGDAARIAREGIADLIHPDTQNGA